MSLGVYDIDNLKRLWNAFYSRGDLSVNDALYAEIVGSNGESKKAYNEYKASDIKAQKALVDATSKKKEFGMGEYIPFTSPMDGYKNASSEFCQAANKWFNVNKISHRLYFNLGALRMDFASVLIQTCVMRKIPYYFKWSKDGHRADNLVVYVEKDKVDDIAKAIEDIARINPVILNNNRQLPMSVENFGWFGYAVGKESYSTKVSLSVARAFDQIMKAYNNDRSQIDAILSNPETEKQFYAWMEYIVKQQFQQDGIPYSFQEEIPEAIRRLAGIQSNAKEPTYEN